jgi:hypothetical protein
MANLFFSYSHKDAARAQRLVRWLEKEGHGVWRGDDDIGGGASFSAEIEKALKECDAVLALWSVSSVQSAWVRDEAGFVPTRASSFRLRALQYQTAPGRSGSPPRSARCAPGKLMHPGIGFLERVTGIEPVRSAWEADRLPLHHTRPAPPELGRAANPVNAR